MTLVLVNTGDTVQNTHINQFTNVLQRSSGQTEVGKYFIVIWSNAANDFGGEWIPTLSRGVTPVSASIDTSTSLDSNLNAPSTGHLDASGFQIFTSSKAASANMGFGGNWTVQF